MPELGRRGNMVATRITIKGKRTEQLHWWFWCPGCEMLHAFTTPRWTRTGTDAAPTFAPSLLCTFGKESTDRCHLFLRGGQLQFLGDCSHELAGETVPLPEPPEWLYREVRDAGNR